MIILFLTMLTGTQAVFKPVDSAALKAAVGTCVKTLSGSHGSYTWIVSCTGGCLGENSTGYCPTFAATNVPGTSNPYGAISGWDTSLVTDMRYSKL